MRRPKSLRVVFNFQNSIALLVLLLFGLVIWWSVAQSGFNLSTPLSLLQSISRLGWLGISIYISLLAMAIVISPIPSTPITAAGGLVWGPIAAGIYGVIGVFLGSLSAYFIGRTLGRKAVKALSGKVIYFSKHRGEAYLGWIMFIVHLIPVFPFDLMSYGAGISGLSLPVYASTTLLGIIPATFFLTHMGSAFTIGKPLVITFVTIFVILAIGLPWGVRRYNWLGLKDVIRLE